MENVTLLLKVLFWFVLAFAIIFLIYLGFRFLT